MKTVRHSLFETNSSAMHSITVQDVKDKSHNTLELDVNDGIVTIELESYTYEPRLLETPTKKLKYYLSYILTHLQSYIDFNRVEYKNYDGYVDFARVKLEKANDFLENSENNFDYQTENGIDISIFLSQLNFIKQIILEFYPNSKIKLIGDPHVSHRAYGIIENYLNIINIDNIKEFLLNPDVIIVIDSQNSKYLNQFSDDSGYFFGDELPLNTKINRDVTFKRLSNILHNSIVSQLKLDYSQCAISLKGVIIDGISYSVDGLVCVPTNNSIVFRTLGKFELLDFHYDKYQKIKNIVIMGDETHEYHLHHHDVRIKSEGMDYYVEFYKY